MYTLLLRLAAPLQAYGIDSLFNVSSAGEVPSKSAVIGMIAAALGLGRNTSLDEYDKYIKLQFGVRVLNEGVDICDFQTACSASGKSYITYRHYLSDAEFVVGLSSEDKEFLNDLHEVLLHPVYPLYLGCKSCPPAVPFVLEVRNKELKDALYDDEYLKKYVTHNSAESLKRHRVIYRDANEDDKYPAFIKDVPVPTVNRCEFTYRPVVRIEDIDQLDDHDLFGCV